MLLVRPQVPGLAPQYSGPPQRHTVDRIHQWTVGAEANSDGRELCDSRPVNTPGIDFTGSAFSLTPSTCLIWVVVIIDNQWSSMYN
jgi:hypothetical protein